MTQSDPRGAHDWHSGAYVQEWIQAYTNEERTANLRRIAHLIPFDPDESIRVLDIGGGWGPVSTVVLEAFPRAEVVLQDFSEPMLAQASRNLASYGDAVSFVHSDLLSPAWKAGLSGQFQAVVSSLAIHNVRFPDRIRSIYEETFPLVAPGGCFLNLDQIFAGNLVGQANRQAQRMDRRRQIHGETGKWQPLSEIAAQSGARGTPQAHGQPTPETLKRIASHEPATLANQLRWLLEAGFDEVECFGRDRGAALIGAFRAPA